MINIANISKAYSEVYSFLNVLGNNYISKIPKSIYDTIKNSRDQSYNPKYTDVESISNQTISKEGLSLISALNLQYWCEDEAQKQELKEIYANNARKETEKYNNIFKENYSNTKDDTKNNINDKISDNIREASTEIIEYKESFFKKLLNKIKEILRNVK